MRNNIYFLFLLLAGSLHARTFDDNILFSASEFIVFDNAGSEIPYRIPAIAQNRNGDIITVVDYRYSKQDIGMAPNGKLDLKYRIKDHKTEDWSEIMTLAAARGEADSNIAFGDPCIVADRESDLVLVTCCSGNVSFPKGTHENHQGWARFISEDGGKNWSNDTDISYQVFDLLDKRKDGHIRCFFIGSGKIAQSNKIKINQFYRIYCSPLVKLNDGTNVNFVLYSDDFGENWKLLGDADNPPIPKGADEAKVVELPDGNVLISSRIKGGRYFNIFHYDNPCSAEGKWDKPVISNAEVNGVMASTNACNGEVLVIPTDSSSDSAPYLLLQSVPLGPTDRKNVGINYKFLNSPEDYKSSESLSKNWDGFFPISNKSSAYSTMILDIDNDLSLLYEENSYNGGYDIVYKKIPIIKIINDLINPAPLQSQNED